MSIVYELEKKSSLVTRAFSAKSCTRDTDSLHSCTRLRLVQEMACLYHECKILPRKHSYPNLIPIFSLFIPYEKDVNHPCTFIVLGIQIKRIPELHESSYFVCLVWVESLICW